MLRTVALEFVPATVEAGPPGAVEEAEKALTLARESGIDGPIGHFMIPGMIEEDPDRPVPMKPRMDPLDTWRAVAPVAGRIRGLCTQVTAFLGERDLKARVTDLLAAGMEGVIFVGVPRTMQDGEGPGLAPTDALSVFRGQVANRGAILIPTRQGEKGRFEFKCDRGATFALTQLLYSDHVVRFLTEFARETSHRPDVLLSFGFVPKVEERVKLIRWLIQDPGNPLVESEQAFVAELAGMSFPAKKRALVELYRRVIDGVRELGFPVSVHLETPYGFAKPAFETFAEMLDYWTPGR